MSWNVDKFSASFILASLFPARRCLPLSFLSYSHLEPASCSPAGVLFIDAPHFVSVPSFLQARKLECFHKQPLLSWPLHCDYLPFCGLMAFINSLIEFSMALGCVVKGHVSMFSLAFSPSPCLCSHTVSHSIIICDHNQPVKLFSPLLFPCPLFFFLFCFVLYLISPSLCTGLSQCNYI